MWKIARIIKSALERAEQLQSTPVQSAPIQSPAEVDKADIAGAVPNLGAGIGAAGSLVTGLATGAGAGSVPVLLPAAVGVAGTYVGNHIGNALADRDIGIWRATPNAAEMGDIAQPITREEVEAVRKARLARQGNQAAVQGVPAK